MGAQEVTQRGAVISDFKIAVKPAVKPDVKRTVIPAKAGIHLSRHATVCFEQDRSLRAWIPAFAGMTAVDKADMNDEKTVRCVTSVKPVKNEPK
jgi:hypothetical protein